MLILVTGLPGSGKSTVARLLAKQLDAHILNSDVIRRELYPIARTYSSQETQQVIRETERRARELLQAGGTVILDALFTKQRPREEYRELAQEIGAPFHIVYVVAPEEKTRERLELRAQLGDASEATFEYYLNRKPHFEAVQGEHFVIHNEGDGASLEANVREVASKLATV